MLITPRLSATGRRSLDISDPHLLLVLLRDHVADLLDEPLDVPDVHQPPDKRLVVERLELVVVLARADEDDGGPGGRDGGQGATTWK
jgi:hypothetical protein